MSTNTRICPICGEGVLHDHTDYENSEYNGVTKKTPLHYSVCSICGSEQANAEQVQTNKQALLDFKRELTM